MNETLSIFLIISIFFFLISEFFGRAKHIGRWWTFFLLIGGFLPGLLALIFSPSAKKKPTKGGNKYKIWGIISLILGILNMIPFFATAGKQGYTFFALVILGIYLIQLSKGKIINETPKFYFDNLKNNIHTQVEKKQEYPKENKNNNHLYFIIENNVQTGPFSLDQLIDKRINENTLVWRKGLEIWKKASEIIEIENIISYNPPPIPTESESNPPPIHQSEEIPNKYWINGKDYTIEEIEIELSKGNYIVYKDSVVYDNSGIEIFIKDTYLFERLMKYFPPD